MISLSSFSDDTSGEALVKWAELFNMSLLFGAKIKESSHVVEWKKDYNSSSFDNSPLLATRFVL